MQGAVMVAECTVDDAATDPSGLMRWLAACPPIDPNRILRVHGYREQGRIRLPIRASAEAMAKRAPELVDARGCWRRVSIEARGHGELSLPGGVLLSCPAFDRLLDGATEIVAFVVTLGARFDEEVIAMMEAFEPLDALFLETAGRLAVERLTRLLAADIGRRLRPEGLTLGARLGPGYTYRMDGQQDEKARVMWPLEQQHQLFALFGSSRLPVELMQSAVMRPKMSRSGVFGITSNGPPQN